MTTFLLEDVDELEFLSEKLEMTISPWQAKRFSTKESASTFRKTLKPVGFIRFNLLIKKHHFSY